MLQECDEYKVRCVQYYGTTVPENQVPALQNKFNIEEQHMLYRYRAFDGFFPTKQWILRPKADHTDPTEDDVYVIFSYSANYHAPRDIIAVEMKAWKIAIVEALRDNDNRLPAIVNHVQPLI